MAKLKKYGWSKNWYISFTGNGGGKHFTTGTSDRREAQRVLARHLALMDAPPATWIMDDLFDAYLADRQGRVRSWASLKYSLDPVRLSFGSTAAADITKMSVRSYAQARRLLGRKNSTIAKELRTMRQALNFGVKDRWLDKAPHIEIPREDPPKDRWLTRAEAAKLLDACIEPHLKVYIMLALHTGARKSAILNLTWDQVDLERGLVVYPPADPHSRKRTAVLPINDELLETLVWAKSGAVTERVVEFRGRGVQDIKKGFLAAVGRAGVAACTPHDLRRTCATWMTEAGIPTSVVARYLADTEEMIEKVYGHHSPDYLRAAARSLSGSN
jgi:integrase